MAPDILLVGHVVKDIVGDGWQAGGGVTYGAMQAKRLGLTVAVVTSCADDVRPAEIVPGVDWHVVPSETSASFENRYAGGRREQRVLSRASQIRLNDVPARLLSTPLALITPVFHEVDAAVAGELQANDACVGLGAQGWLRRLEDRTVVVDRVDPLPDWLHADVVFVSEEDVLDPESVACWRERLPTVVLTRGRRGCTVWDIAGRHDVPAFETAEVDATGAGDVFAVAFLVRFHETSDGPEAASFASAAAALAVTRRGLEGIASRSEIEALIRTRAPVRLR